MCVLRHQVSVLLKFEFQTTVNGIGKTNAIRDMILLFNTHNCELLEGRVAQWLRRLPTEQEIPGSSPGVIVFCYTFFTYCNTFSNSITISAGVWNGGCS